MTPPLHRTASYPSNRAFVIKLHRDVDVGSGALHGRIEHILSGRAADFADIRELAARLIELTLLRREQDANQTDP